jgi:ketosteroid isomerase-like protein
MSATDVARGYFDALDRHDLDAAADFLDDDVVEKRSRASASSAAAPRCATSSTG